MTEITFEDVTNGAFALMALWPKVGATVIRQYAKEMFDYELSEFEVKSFRDAAGVTNEKFVRLGRKIAEWALISQLARHGFASRTFEDLLARCVDEVNRLLRGTYNKLLIEEWVEAYHTELAPLEMKPFRLKVIAAERTAELQKLLGCQSPPTISSKA